MIEIMSRDGSVCDSDLYNYALKLKKDTGQEVTALFSSDAASVTFWGVEDVRQALKDYGYEDLAALSDDRLWLFLNSIEIELHENMVAAGWDTIGQCLIDWVEDQYNQIEDGVEPTAEMPEQ